MSIEVTKCGKYIENKTWKCKKYYQDMKDIECTIIYIEWVWVNGDK